MSLRVAVLDYEMSNLRSAAKALERLGAAVRVARTPAEMGRYDAVVLGGDLSYSTVEPSSCSAANPGCDSLEFVWDFFGLQIEPFAATAALLFYFRRRGWVGSARPRVVLPEDERAPGS